MNKSNLRVGVVGVGFGTIVQIPGFQAENIEVVAVCSRRIERAQEAAQQFGIPHAFSDYQDMLRLEGLDAVSIVTPPALHHSMAIAALEAGKHVLCEKPFALNKNQAWEMYDLSQRTGLTSMITHEFRWAPQRAYIKELLDQGYLGRLNLAGLRLFFGPRDAVRARPATWALDADLGGGFLYALGSHYIDALRHWFGEITKVSGSVWTYYPDRVDETEQTIKATADDTFHFTLEFQNGGHASMHASSIAPFGGGAKIELFGTDGTLSSPQIGVNPPPDGVVLGAKVGHEVLKELPMPDRFQPFLDERDGRSLPFRLLVREFARGVDGGISPSPNFYDGFRCQQVLDAVLESSRTNSQVSIAEQ